MSVALIVLLLVIAIGLILVEIFLIPGVGAAGIAGLVIMVGTIYLAYEESANYGHIVLTVSVVASVGLAILSLRAKTWERISHKSSIDSKVNLINELVVKKGMVGTTITRLNPTGKVRFENEVVEAEARTGFIDENQKVEIINIDGSKIHVKPASNA